MTPLQRGACCASDACAKGSAKNNIAANISVLMIFEK